MIEKLSNTMMLKDVFTTTDNCRYCLMCRNVCPVGHVTQLETLTPHGWGLIVASIQRGLLSWNPETIEILYSCADCGTCQAHCVTDQPLPSAIALARADIVEYKKAPKKVQEIHELIRAYRNPFVPETMEPNREKGDVALFVGDEAKYLMPDMLESVVGLLQSIGIEPVLIGVGRNNGYLASSLGLLEAARTLAQTTLDELDASGVKRLLVLSPGDYYTFDTLYRERLGVELPEDVHLSEVVTLLAEQMDQGVIRFRKSSEKATYAYIDPTHAIRVPKRHDAPRKLLAAIMPDKARELFWRRDRTHPVGSTALQFTKPAIAEKLTRARLEDALQSGAKFLFSDDPGTAFQLQMYANEVGLQLHGFYEWLSEHLIGA